mmetsp:Transcript_25003/g.34719  ORF Transcript_25003/g.34719 Transcript_25003/m.34719 type:complete len:123 (-) Transcript_25003:2-370(-)
MVAIARRKRRKREMRRTMRTSLMAGNGPPEEHMMMIKWKRKCLEYQPLISWESSHQALKTATTKRAAARTVMHKLTKHKKSCDLFEVGEGVCMQQFIHKRKLLARLVPGCVAAHGIVCGVMG